MTVCDESLPVEVYRCWNANCAKKTPQPDATTNTDHIVTTLMHLVGVPPVPTGNMTPPCRAESWYTHWRWCCWCLQSFRKLWQTQAVRLQVSKLIKNIQKTSKKPFHMSLVLECEINSFTFQRFYLEMVSEAIYFYIASSPHTNNSNHSMGRCNSM